MSQELVLLKGPPPGEHSTQPRCLTPTVYRGLLYLFSLGWRLGHQTLASEILSWVWLQEAAAVSLVRVRLLNARGRLLSVWNLPIDLFAWETLPYRLMPWTT